VAALLVAHAIKGPPPSCRRPGRVIHQNCAYVRLLVFLLHSMLGLLSGLVGTLLIGRASTRPPAPTTTEEDEPSLESRAEGRQAGRALVEAAVVATRATAFPESQVSASSPAEQANDRLRDYQRRIDEHKHVPPDITWGPKAQQAVSVELTTMATNSGFG
jgi:hypothetical protein